MKFPKPPWMECKATNRTSLIDYLKRSEKAKEALRKRLEPIANWKPILFCSPSIMDGKRCLAKELLEEWLA